MSEPLVVVGAGGFGREALDVAEAMNRTKPSWEVVGVADDSPSDVNLERLERRGIAHLGGVDSVPEGVAVVIGVGSPAARRAIGESLARRGYGFASLVHPTAVLGSEVRIAEGAVICAGVSIGTNVRLGRHVHLNPHAVIGHDTVLGDHVSVNPNATVSGECVIEDEVLLGAGAVVLNRLRVGAGAVVGGAACVIDDVEAVATVMGVPARPRGRS